jgi:hypothetical protein
VDSIPRDPEFATTGSRIVSARTVLFILRVARLVKVLGAVLLDEGADGLFEVRFKPEKDLIRRYSGSIGKLTSNYYR